MNRDLTKGPIVKSMLLFAVPMILGDLLQQCYNIVDTLIVGHWLGRNALAAVGSSFTLMTFLTSVILGLCLGSGALFSIRKSAHSIYPFLSPTIKGKSKTGGRKTMKTKRKYFYLDDFEHKLLVDCLMTARNEYINEDKPIEDVNELILKIIDAPSKKLRVIVKEDV